MRIHQQNIHFSFPFFVLFQTVIVKKANIIIIVEIHLLSFRIKQRLSGNKTEILKVTESFLTSNNNINKIHLHALVAAHFNTLELFCTSYFPSESSPLQLYCLTSGAPGSSFSWWCIFLSHIIIDAAWPSQ